MREHDNLVYTCMFGGGAIRGAAHVGVVKALDELGIKTPTLVGSSVGAMFAMLYAVGYSYQELAEVFLSVNFELFRDLSLGFNQKFALSKGEVFLDWLRDLVESKFYGDDYIKGKNPPVKFKDIDKNLIIITTNINTFECREFSNLLTPDFEVAMAVRISCCMPGLMRAITLDDALLVDGDLMKGKPMWMHSPSIKASGNRLLEVRLEGSFLGGDDSALDYVNGMYSCMTSTETDFIKSLYSDCDNYDYLVINTGDVVVVDFNYPNEKRQAIIDNGYKQAIEYFTVTLVEKKIRLKKIYNSLLTYLYHSRALFGCSKYSAVKNCINEMFVTLLEYRDLIDVAELNNLKLLQKLISSNVKTGLLGRSTCLNREVIYKTIDSLIVNFESRIKSFDVYVDKFKIQCCV